MGHTDSILVAEETPTCERFVFRDSEPESGFVHDALIGGRFYKTVKRPWKQPVRMPTAEERRNYEEAVNACKSGS